MKGVYPDDGQGCPGATAVETYAYDGAHRRIGRTRYPGGTARTERFYYNESWQVVQEESSAGTTQGQYVWDVRYIDAAVLRDFDGDYDPQTGDLGVEDSGLEERLYYLNDANMNVTALVAATDGAVVERYRYDPYGRATVLEGVRDVNGSDTSAVEWQPRMAGNDFVNEILYCGYRIDWYTGYYYVRHRYLHSTLGRWMTWDPIGYEDGANLYCAYFVPHGADPFGRRVYLITNVAFGAQLVNRFVKGGIRHCAIEVVDKEGNSTHIEASPNPNQGVANPVPSFPFVKSGPRIKSISRENRARYNQETFGERERYLVVDCYEKDDGYIKAGASTPVDKWDLFSNNCCHWARRIIEGQGDSWPVKEDMHMGQNQGNPGFTGPTGPSFPADMPIEDALQEYMERILDAEDPMVAPVPWGAK